MITCINKLIHNLLSEDQEQGKEYTNSNHKLTYNVLTHRIQPHCHQMPNQDVGIFLQNMSTISQVICGVK